MVILEPGLYAAIGMKRGGNFSFVSVKNDSNELKRAQDILVVGRRQDSGSIHLPYSIDQSEWCIEQAHIAYDPNLIP